MRYSDFPGAFQVRRIAYSAHPMASNRARPGDGGGFGAKHERAKRNRCDKGADGAIRSRSAGVQPPSGPTSNAGPVMGLDRAGTWRAKNVPARRTTAARPASRPGRRPAAWAGRQPGRSGVRSVRRPRWRWRAAGRRLTRAALVRSVMTGRMREQPSSTAWRTTRSVASRFSRANISQGPASACWGRSCALEAQREAVPAGERDPAEPLAVGPVEQTHGIAGRAAQDGAQVMRLLARGVDVGGLHAGSPRRTAAVACRSVWPSVSRCRLTWSC